MMKALRILGYKCECNVKSGSQKGWMDVEWICLSQDIVIHRCLWI